MNRETWKNWGNSNQALQFTARFISRLFSPRCGACLRIEQSNDVYKYSKRKSGSCNFQWNCIGIEISDRKHQTGDGRKRIVWHSKIFARHRCNDIEIQRKWCKSNLLKTVKAISPGFWASTLNIKAPGVLKLKKDSKAEKFRSCTMTSTDSDYFRCCFAQCPWTRPEKLKM